MTFRFNNTTPTTFLDDLPIASDVVIVGGGIAGICTAWYLRQAGHSVLVLEKGIIAGEQSSRNWGWVRVTGRDPAEVPIAIDSLRLWQVLSEQIGPKLGFRVEGVLGLAETEKDLDELGGWIALAEEYNLDSRMLSDREVTRHIDVPTGHWKGGLITPSDARAEPFTAVPAMAQALHAHGGMIRERCAVRTVEREAGRVCAVVTEAGVVRTSAVVCAAGAWSSLFLENLGIDLPQLAVRGTVTRTAAAPNVFAGAGVLKDIAIRRRLDGGYTVASTLAQHYIGINSFRYLIKFLPGMGSASEIAIRLGRDPTQRSLLKPSWDGDCASPFETHRVLDPRPSAKALKQIRHRLNQRIPELRGVAIEEAWAGMIDATPDVVPVMDEVQDWRGLYVATGFSGHGFGLGPGAGRVMARMVMGEPCEFDLQRFRFARFSDGSRMRPGPAI